MRTPDSKSVKQTLKSNGIEVKRSVVFSRKLTVTVAIDDAEKALSILNSLGLKQSWNPYAPATEIKTNRVGCLGVAEFTSLVQL